MTTVTVEVNSEDVTAALKRIDIWQQILPHGIGRFQIALFNARGQYSNFFPADSIVKITVSGKKFPGCNGYLDIVKPRVISERNQKFQQILELSGRDYGQDLMNKSAYGVFNDYAYTILSTLLSGSEITPVWTVLPSIIYFDTKGRAYLVDIVKQVLDLINYEGLRG